MSNLKSLKTWARVALIIGLGSLLVAVVIWLLNRQFDDPVRIALAVGVLGLALAALFNPGAVQRWLQGRQARYGSNVVIMTVALVGILGMAYYLVVNGPLPPEWKRKDFTQDQSNTLAPETLAAIKAMPTPVKVVGFYSTNFSGQRDSAQKLLAQYQTLSKGKLTYEFHDPVGEPALTKAYSVTSDGTLVMVSGTAREELTFASEQDLTGALIRLAHPVSRTVYFLTGHGERDIASSDNNGIASNVDLLKKQNYLVLPLNLAVSGTVPSDARVVVVAGSLTPLSDKEVQAVNDFLGRGGSLVALVDPTVATQAGPAQPDPLAAYLTNSWGLKLDPDVVVDNYNSANGQPLFPLNHGYESSPITDKLQKIATVFPVARSVTISGTAQTFPDITYTALVKTDPRAWGETDMTSLQNGTAQFGAGDVSGPMNLGVSMVNNKTKARVVVFGNSGFSSNQVFGVGANSLLFVNTINWASLDESLISLTPKVPTTRTLNIVSGFTMNLIFFIVVIVMPVFVAIMGVAVWFMRRQHV
jgi:ABC-type uncharacterized transport system involved in gliding motility auxiliary subunit